MMMNMMIIMRIDDVHDDDDDNVYDYDNDNDNDIGNGDESDNDNHNDEMYEDDNDDEKFKNLFYLLCKNTNPVTSFGLGIFKGSLYLLFAGFLCSISY